MRPSRSRVARSTAHGMPGRGRGRTIRWSGMARWAEPQIAPAATTFSALAEPIAATVDPDDPDPPVGWNAVSMVPGPVPEDAGGAAPAAGPELMTPMPRPNRPPTTALVGSWKRTKKTSWVTAPWAARIVIATSARV